jgi:hypothetical protein
LDYVEFEHFPKKKAQVDLERKIQQLEIIVASSNDPAVHDELNQLRRKLSGIVKSQRFRLGGKRYYCTFDGNSLGPTPDMGARGMRKAKCVMKKKPLWKKIILDQLPVNTNDATTAHKLQGASKQNIIVHNWVYSHGWVYTVLSRVRTRKGLYLRKKLHYQNNGAYYRLPRELLWFENRMKSKIPDRAK